MTLLYIFHPNLSQPKREALLAARALIYAKLITKEEIAGASNTLPHLLDERACIEMTARLSLEDCRQLFPKVRRAGTHNAYEIVKDFLDLSVSMCENVG